ncbi:MAG: hypothetical protein ACREBG_29585 [Pyrinomonadaceae bacterium]
MSARFLAPTLLSSVFIHLGLAISVHAQAWLPLKGEGQVAVTYQNIYVKDHVDFEGNRFDSGPIRTHTVISSFEYGLTSKLALDAEITHVSSKYEGFVGPVPHGPVDTGSYHPSFQDVRIGVRYNLRSRPLVVTPFVATVIPTHHYETRGHSAVGRRLRELHMGVFLGRDLEEILPRSYVQGRYSYAIVEGVEEFNLNRSNGDWEFGYFATDRISLRFTGAWQRTYHGIEIPKDRSHPHFHEIHDRATKANFVRVGGGVSFSLTNSLGLHADFNNTARGLNTHAPRGISLGISWRFSRRGFRVDGS